MFPELRDYHINPKRIYSRLKKFLAHLIHFYHFLTFVGCRYAGDAVFKVGIDPGITAGISDLQVRSLKGSSSHQKQ